MLADTPWTFPFVLGWMLLSVIAPLLLVVVLVLSSLRATRRIGLWMLFFGVVGALFGCIGDAALAVWVGERLSQSTVIGWLFAAGGGFSLFAIPAGVVTGTSLHTRGLTNRSS
jgi:hypothetical protein